MHWNYRIGRYKNEHHTDPEWLYKIIDCYYNDDGVCTAYGSPDLRCIDNPEELHLMSSKLKTLHDASIPIIDLDNFPDKIPQDLDFRFEFFLGKVLRMNLFETFQNFMAARGIFVSIVADSYKFGEVCWRGFIAYKDPETGEWIEDDLGATDLHEMQYITKKAAVELALELKVSWY